MSLTDGSVPNPAAKAGLPWELYKDLISTLYASNSLEHVMQIMKVEHAFAASENQYKKQIAKWGQDKKRVKSKEYLAILKHKRSMRRGETGKHVDYFLNGKRVPASDIVRFEKRMLKQKKISERDTFSDIEIPHTLTWSEMSPPPSRTARCPSQDAQVHLQGDKEHVLTLDSMIEVPLSGDTAITWPTSNNLLHDHSVPKQRHRLPNTMPVDPKFYHSQSGGVAEDSLQETVDTPSIGDAPVPLTPISFFSRSQTPSQLASSTRMNTPPPSITGTPPSSNFDWWSAYENFSSSPPEAFYSTAPRHDLEQLLRNFGHKLASHEEEQIYDSIFQESINCQGHCNFCLFYQPTTEFAGRCRLGRILTKLHSQQRSQKLSSERSSRLAAHAVFWLLSESHPSHLALFHYAYWLLTITRNPYLLGIMQSFFASFVDPIPHARALVLAQLAYAFTIFLRYDEGLATLRCLFDSQYLKMEHLCERFEGKPFSYPAVTLCITDGEVTAEVRDDGYVTYHPTELHRSSKGTQWFHERYGRLKFDEIQGRVEALYLMCRIKRLKREAMQRADRWNQASRSSST